MVTLSLARTTLQTMPLLASGSILTGFDCRCGIQAKMAGDLLLRRDFAACACGCGGKPPLAERTSNHVGITKGQPVKCIPGHQGRLGTRKRSSLARADLPDLNPSGLCWCGCGATTGIARQTDAKHGEYLGRHNRFRRGHQARWLAEPARQARLRAPQGRQICLSCFIDRPLIAYVDSTPTCVACLARVARVARVDQQLQERAQALAKSRHERAIQAHATKILKGTFKRRLSDITIGKSRKGSL
jgi:hypothetical protein